MELLFTIGNMGSNVSAEDSRYVHSGGSKGGLVGGTGRARAPPLLQEQYGNHANVIP